MSNINLSNTQSGSVKVPPSFKDVVTLRVKESSFGKSKNSGKEQSTLKCEIVKPDEVVLDGSKYILSGQEITFYLGLSDEKSSGAKTSPMANTKEFHQKLGLSMDIDTDNLPYNGVCFEFYLTSTENILTRPGSDGKYEAILDENGKPRTLGWQWSNYVNNVIGPSSFDASNIPY
jgi:hypothetical protein